MAAAVSEAPGAMATSEDDRIAKEIEMLSDDLIQDLHDYLDGIVTAGQ